MKFFLLSDLHLGRDMTEFGSWWRNHEIKIELNWKKTISSEDVVLIPGDISWGRKLKDAQADLDFISSLPGVKFIIRGNHDWWWKNFNKVKSALRSDITPVNFKHPTLYKGVIIAGEKGSLVPGDKYYKAEKHFQSYEKNVVKVAKALEELARFKKFLNEPVRATVFMLHYPPCNFDGSANVYARMVIESKLVDYLVYGHLHSQEEWNNALKGEIEGVHFILGSADYLDFEPVEIFSLGEDV